MKLYRDFTTQEEIDRQYDVEAMVPDFRPYATFFVEASRQARAELPCQLDVRFGPTLDETFDVFPALAPDAPVLVFIHGGYWRILSSKEWSLVARGPAARGVTVVVTNYSLCPTVTIDEITRQSRAAVAFLHREARRFNGDPNQIHVAGHSAGGQQVGMLLVTDWAGDYGLSADVIKGGIAISGLFDLEPLRYSWLQPKLLLTHETVVRQSPLRHIPDSAPPLLVTLGGDESLEFHRQSQEYLAAWRANGLDGRFLAQPGKNHFTAIEGFIDPTSELCRAIFDLMGIGNPAGIRDRPHATIPTGPTPRSGPPPVPSFGPKRPRLSFEHRRS